LRLPIANLGGRKLGVIEHKGRGSLDAVIHVYDEAGNVIETHAMYTRTLDILDQ
jgi:hypothetical protein